MRVVFFVVLIVVLALVGYVGIGGYFLAHTLAGILRTGPIAAVLATAEPPTDPLALGYKGDPMAAFSLPFQTVQVETALGPADAWLVPATGPEAGRAIYVHGIAGSREDGYRHLSLLHEAGWSVLLITYRNDPDGPADPSGRYGFGLSEWPDLEAAVAYMAPEDSSPGALVVAESMGGAIVGQFLAQSPLASRVKALALDSPGLSYKAVVGHLGTQSGKPLSAALAWTAAKLLPWQTGLDLDRAEVGAVVAAFPGPLFIAHGSADRIVPIVPSQALAANRPDTTVTLWTGADHLGSFAEDPAAYRTAFMEFLSRIS